MENPLKRFDVVVVGAGYVGLVTGATLSHLGHRVTCVDRDEERISALESGRLPFYEPNLEELVSLGVNSERLSFVDPAALAGLLRTTRTHDDTGHNSPAFYHPRGGRDPRSGAGAPGRIRGLGHARSQRSRPV